jgi:hypothetical protein
LLEKKGLRGVLVTIFASLVNNPNAIPAPSDVINYDFKKNLF